MDWKPFWKIVEESYRPDPIDHFEALKECLEKLTWPEIIEFQARFDEAITVANSLALWGAAHLINGGCSDDGFRDFRVWLVGRDVTRLKRPSRIRTRWPTFSMATRSMASASMPPPSASMKRKPA